MARTLSSSSFPLTTAPPPRFTVAAKIAAQFRPEKLPERDDTVSSEGTNSNPFKFNLGKISEVKSLIPVVVSGAPALGNPRRKDAATVFVAGAAGQVGVRIAQKLLREGFRVRAGVPELGIAQDLARFASDYKIISNEESNRLNAVESTFNDPQSIAKAIGNASKVVVTIGPSENGPNKEVTTSDALLVVEAAELAGATHVAIIYDPTAAASSYNVIDGITSFFNNLFAKSEPLSVSEFLQKVIQTDIRYTFIKAGLIDDFLAEGAYNVVVAAEGNTGTADYKVTKTGMAALVADIFSNTAVAEDKVVEVYADPSAPSRPVDALFSAIPEDGRRKAYAEAQARVKAEEEALKASEAAKEAAKAKKKLEEEVKKLSKQEARAAILAEEAKAKAETAGTSVETLLSKAKNLGSGLGSGFAWEKLGSQLANAVPKPVAETPKVQIATVRGQAKARSLPAQKAVVRQPRASPVKQSGKEEEEETKGTGREEGKKEVRNIFGGLFKQETVYVDDD